MNIRKTAYPDAGTAIAIAAEMAISIKAIIDGLQVFGDKSKNRALSDEIKRVADTARLIGLRLVTTVFDKAFDFAVMVESSGVIPDAAKKEALSGILSASHRYIAGVANGKIGTGFVLHSAYVELMRFLPDQHVALRQEFFLPVSPVYSENSSTYNEGRFIAEVARYNDEFRQAMKRYESTQDLETINAMRTTLVTMETKNPPSNFRMLLSLAISFMDVAMRNGGKIAKENEPLIACLESELSGVSKGEVDVDEGTISWFMYVIGQATQFSARIRAFQESYELVRLVEESQNTTINDQTIAAMRGALENAQRTWEASLVTQGNLSSAKSACFALAAVSNTLGDYALKTMAMAMGSLADGIVEKRVSADSEIAVFGASIIVAMNERLDRVLLDPKSGRESAEYHRDRVRQVLTGARPSELSREIKSQGGHVQAILVELSNDLSSAEQIIDQCLRDGAKQAKREDIDKLFNIVKSALSFVNFSSAAAYAADVALHVDKILVDLIALKQPNDADKRLLADSVMMLHRYINTVSVDKSQAEQSLQRGLSLFVVVPEIVKEEIVDDEGSFDVCTDEDLGPIFFEEAREVVSSLILPGLEKLRININDEAVMLDVRRGFHTLKGSSRMVELNNIGLIGQYTEYALNIYRDNRNLLPNGLFLDWLEGAAKLVAGAVDILEQGKPARVMAAPYELVYKQFVETNVFERVDLSAEDLQKLEKASVIERVVVADETAPLALIAIDEINESHVDVEAAFHDEELMQVSMPTQLELANNDLQFALTDAVAVASERVVAAEKAVEASLHADLVLTSEVISDTEPMAVISESVSIVAIDAVELVTETVVESSGEVSVGDVVIPTQLYIAFVNEAATFQGALNKAIMDVVSAKRTSVDFEVMRMAHSLAGMGRATGLKAVAHLAEKVEEWVSINQDRQVYITENTKDVLMDAMEALDAMVVGVEDKLEPMMELSIVQRLSLVIDADERRIAMAQDTREEITDSVIEKLASECDFDVSDDGVALSATAHQEIKSMDPGMPPDPPSLLDNSIILSTPAEFVEPETLATLNVVKEQMEVAKASYAFRRQSHTPTTEERDLSREADHSDSAVCDSELVTTENFRTEVSTIAPERSAIGGADTKANEADFEDAPGYSQGRQGRQGREADEKVVDLGPDHGDVFQKIVELESTDETFVDEEILEILSLTTQDTENMESLENPNEQMQTDNLFEQQLVLTSSQEVLVAEESEAIEKIVESISASTWMIPPTVQTTVRSEVSSAYVSARSASALKMLGGLDWLKIIDTRQDDVDAEMFDIFFEEANERFEEIDSTLNALQDDINDKRQANILKRAVHTLKGSANTAGCRKVGVIFHHLEDLMDSVSTLTVQNVAVLQSGVDAAFAGLKAMRAGKSVESAIKKITRVAAAINNGANEVTVAEISDSSHVVSISEQPPLLFADAEADTQSTMTITSSIDTVDRIDSSVVIAPLVIDESAASVSSVSSAQTLSPTVRAASTSKKVSKTEEDEGSLRVSTRLLDKMVKTVGEINISRSRMGMNVDVTKMALTGLASSLERMYSYLRQVEMEAERQMSAGDQGSKRDSKFDALQMDTFTRLQELTRRVAEAQNDVMTQQSSAVGASRDMEEALATQNVLTGELSGDLDQIRQVRVSSIVPALKRVVRAACRDTGKAGEIFFDADVEIDRGILSKVMGSLEHILRNAVAHGIEDPAQRKLAGKEETGAIEFRAFQDGSEVVIEIRDDGRGMDTRKIYESAIKKGVIKANGQMSETQIRELIFEPGFSTVSEVTDIAGRGVGLDVVRSDISAMGGRVELMSTLGSGTTFVLRVPATLTEIAGAAVTTNGHMYVIPAAFIDRLVRINAKQLEDSYKSRQLLVTDELTGTSIEYEFWGMWQIAGAKSWDSAPLSRNSVLLMRNDRVAVHIDDIRPATEFVFRALGPQVTNSSGLIGSTISSGGNASLVLDPSRVSRTLRSLMKSGQINTLSSLSDQKKSALVLVVDDSMTVRKVTARFLKKEGFRCVEAENGMKALEVLQKEMPDVILMDIEMPVMNGFDASQAIRATPETAGIPIIMITSRVGDSHRKRAMEIGVNGYLGKPYNENDLLNAIKSFTDSSEQKIVNS